MKTNQIILSTRKAGQGHMVKGVSEALHTMCGEETPCGPAELGKQQVKQLNVF